MRGKEVGLIKIKNKSETRREKKRQNERDTEREQERERERERRRTETGGQTYRHVELDKGQAVRQKDRDRRTDIQTG